MLNFFNSLKDSAKQKAKERVEFVRENAWKIEKVPYYLEDNMRATMGTTMAAIVATTAYAVSSASEELDTFKVVAGSLACVASAYSAYSLYKNYQHNKAVQDRLDSMNTDEDSRYDPDFIDRSYNPENEHRTRSGLVYRMDI